MKKRFLCGFLVMCMAVTMLAVSTVTANEEFTSGIYTYIVQDGKATITDCDTSASGSITIPSTLGGYSVTSIGDSAFFLCDSLTSITIPNSVTSIGNSAFSSCHSLTSITIPDSVTSIGEEAFSFCYSLTSITIPDSVTSIGEEAFYYCYSLTSITIPNSVTSIGDRAFSECYSLTINVNKNNKYYCSVDGNLFDKNKTTLIQYAIGKSDTSYIIPNSVTFIGGSAFYYCYNLTSITIPNSVTSIGDEAFSGCDGLTSITIPNSVTSIGNGAFSHCRSLISINVNENNKYYCSVDGILYNKNKTILIQYAIGKTDTSYIIPNSVTSIGYRAFSGCYSLTSITIPNSVTSIGDAAFSNCRSLTSITIPNSVTSIGYWAFSGCYSLTSITIPNSVTSIDYGAFSNCRSLKDVYYSGSENEWNNIAVESGNEDLKNATIHFNSIAPTSPSKKLTKMALCKAVYNNLPKDKTLTELIKDNRLPEGNKLMFYNYDTKQTIKWKTFIEKYAGDMKVIETLSETTDNGLACKEFGFYGAAFQDRQGDIIIAYRGTDDTEDWWNTNIPMFSTIGGLSVQFTKALELYDTVRNDFPNSNIELTGHSLGGALASYVAIMRGVRTDNVNGATGWMFNNFIYVDPSFLIGFKGFDSHVNEMYNEKILNQNWLVTMANRGSFNYALYKTPTLYNKYNKEKDTYTHDYHAISSIIDYQYGEFDFTKASKTYVWDRNDFVVFGGALMGTTRNNTFIADVYNSKFYVDERTGKAISPTNSQQLTEIQNNPYMIPGMPDNSNKVLLCGDGNDSVRIYGGNDTIIGGAGNDTLNGGAGNDTYYFGKDWGNDTITDITGKDMLIFTDTPMSEIHVEKTSDYILLTAGSNSVKILKKGRQTKGSSMKIKASGEVSGDIFTTELLNENTISPFALRTLTANEETAKQLYISGVATLEVYDKEGNLIETVSNTETEYIIGDYGAITLSSEGEHPFIEGVFTENDYNFVITSDEKVTCSMSMNADSQNINNLSVISTDIPVGAKLETSTIPNAEGKAEFRLVYDNEFSEALEKIHLQSTEGISITPEKDTIYTGESISLSAVFSPQDTLMQLAEWTWESEDGAIEIIQDDDGNITLIGTKAGTVTVKATANDGSGVYGEAIIFVKSDPSPSVVMTAGDKPYTSGETATLPVKITVGSVDGYETIVEGNCSFDIENNCYTVTSNGDFDISVYGKNSTTGAVTQKVKVNVVQEGLVWSIKQVDYDEENVILEISQVKDGTQADILVAVYDKATKKLEKLEFIPVLTDTNKYTIPITGLSNGNIKILLWEHTTLSPLCKNYEE